MAKVRAENMDGEVSSSHCEFSCSEKIKVSEVKDAEPLKMAEEGSLEPLTPVPERNGEAIVGSHTPLTWVSSPLKLITVDSDGGEVGFDASVRTPKGRVFDPFAPGPDELIFAPIKKTLEESRARTMRRLDFDSFDISMENVGENDVEDVHEETLLESVYESFLDAIVSKQAEGILAENSNSKFGACDGLKTPTSSPPLKGIAETCPGAPMKPAREEKKFNIGICRKLEF